MKIFYPLLQEAVMTCMTEQSMNIGILFYFIGKTACGALLNRKMPARRRARRQDDPWIRRYKNLPLQNRR